MVITHKVEGYANFCNFIKTLDKENVYVYFSGSKLPSGESWCPDCVLAQPIVESELANVDENSHFVYVDVGDRSTWKSQDCPFRTDSKTRLMVIPTLIRWKTPQKLEGEQCINPDLVKMLFTEED